MREMIQSVPTIVYPTSDGKPMAETEAHRDLMIDFIQMLKDHFKEDDDVCVSGNMLMYYEEGNMKKCVAPDVFVVLGVAKKLRNTYLTWEEGQTPDFVLEVASPKTYSNDIGEKKELYASVLAVKEYYIYDPLGQIIPSFIGYQLKNGVYQEIEFVDDRLPSEVLGLELGEHHRGLRLYNPIISEWLQPPSERIETAETLAKDAVERAEHEANARKNAERIAEHEANARKNAESELTQALEELERLRAEKNK